MKSHSVPEFRTVYWGEDLSTEVVFETITKLPPEELVTACMVVAVYGDSIVISKPQRGWGLLGGHREDGETAEECARREAYEEASAVLGELRLVGRWATQKRFNSPYNDKYPDVAYQLLYIADVRELHAFSPRFEITERAVVPFANLQDYYHDFENFSDIFAHVLSMIHNE